MIITNQRRMAAAILSQKEGRPVGVHRIWIDPDYLDEVISAVQKDDVRRLISDGIIKARPIKGTSRTRARKAALQKSKGRRKGHGTCYSYHADVSDLCRLLASGGSRRV